MVDHLALFPPRSLSASIALLPPEISEDMFYIPRVDDADEFRLDVGNHPNPVGSVAIGVLPA